jgi:uncharacterized membrane protein YgaE (UPF0421/DUF939 family)
MRNKTFPKENQKKLNETIRDLKAALRQVEKERDFYKNEVEALVKPTRTRKQHIEQPKMSEAEWRLDFLRRYRTEVLGKKE